MRSNWHRPRRDSRGRLSLRRTVLLVLLVDERVGHAGDIVADHSRQRLFGGLLAVVAREIVGLFHPVGKEFSGDALGVFFFRRQRGAVVKIFVEKLFQLTALGFDGWAEGCQALAVAADVCERMYASGLHTLRRVRNQVAYQAVKNALQRLIKNQLR